MKAQYWRGDKMVVELHEVPSLRHFYEKVMADQTKVRIYTALTEERGPIVVSGKITDVGSDFIAMVAPTGQNIIPLSAIQRILVITEE